MHLGCWIMPRSTLHRIFRNRQCSCQNFQSGCVSNGTECVDGKDCSKFQGTQIICQAFKAYCTNPTSVIDATTPCIARSCDDNYLTYNNDEDCNGYLKGCISKGNGCISPSSPCSSYSGSKIQCQKFKGTNGTIQCWSTSESGSCEDIKCSLATDMTNNKSCDGFLSGCFYDGNGSCVEKTAQCTDYFGDATTCLNFIGNETNKCFKGSNGKCKNRVCGDNTTAKNDSDCDIFLSGCRTNGNGCVDPTQPCSSYSGTPDQCYTFIGNGKVCIGAQVCIAKTCSNKTDATSNSDCVNYLSTCRLKYGTNLCINAVSTCIEFTNFVNGATDQQKLNYCDSVKTLDGKSCSFDTTIPNTCTDLACHLWKSALGVNCVDLLGKATCKLDTENKCYKADVCSKYVIPNSKTLAADKLAWCNQMTDNSSDSLKCTFDSKESSTNCSVINQCEEVLSSTSADTCNSYLKDGICQYYNGKCYTTAKTCDKYSLTGITNQTEFCSKLKQNDSGIVTDCVYNSSASQLNCSKFINTSLPSNCETISSPTEQADCSIISGCKYYNSKCYTIKECINYSTFDDSQTRLLFCQNMLDITTKQFCHYDNSNDKCGAPFSQCSDVDNTYNNVAGSPTKGLSELCPYFRKGDGLVCTYIIGGNYCSDPNYNSSEPCQVVAHGEITSESQCDLYTLPICLKVQTRCQRTPDCQSFDISNVKNKLFACQTKIIKVGNYCTLGSNDECASAPTSCISWSLETGLSNELEYCQKRISLNGSYCSWISGSNCADVSICEDITGVQSQVDCDLRLQGCLYNYSKKSCYGKKSDCSDYSAIGNTSNDYPAYCNSLKNSQGVQCTYLFGLKCINIQSCASYNVGNAPNKFKSCQQVLTTDSLSCTFFSTIQQVCQNISDCDSYLKGDDSDCYSIKSTNGDCKPKTMGQCRSLICEDIIPTSVSDCDSLKGCVFYSSKCITLKNDCTYSYSGTTAKSYCNGLKNINGDFCTAEFDISTACQNRTCSDLETNKFTTHLECQTYSSLCKSNGKYCIDATKTCTEQTAGDCTWILDTDNKSTCTFQLKAGNCIDFDCGSNTTATSDVECQKLHPSCLTKGVGCISKVSPCSSYSGTKETCNKFTGNGKKCQGDSTTTDIACRDPICSDKTTAANQTECTSFKNDCIYNGIGCIDKNSPCSAFVGTQMSCTNFMGNDSVYQCWGTSTSTSSACKVRQCSDKKATSDAECNIFMPPQGTSTTPLCITDGVQCTENNKQCSFFKGNDDSCSKFTATDGICKANSQSSTPVPCTLRICSEAPNNYNTDQQCDSYQKGCKTTGRGCSDSLKCKDIQTSNACSASTGCQWATQCRAAPSTCASLTSQGQSICVNTPLANGKLCAWYNDTCRDYSCVDYDATIKAHTDCQKKDKTCTTSGSGCVTMGLCSSYKSKTICEAANTTESSIRCGWNTITNTCRQRQCADGIFKTDSDCNTFLVGCKSSGGTCIGPNYGCDVFTRYPKNCLKNSSGQPCLRVNNICYDFDDCTDAPFSDLPTCQLFSSLCVSDISKCKAMTFCEKYENQVQCTIGLNSTNVPAICGWLPTGKCATFNNCNEATGTSLSDCNTWNQKCVSDGTKCIDKGNCSTYLTEAACDNTGTDGLCKWTGATCKLRECGDNSVATSESDCQSYIVATGACTFDGTKCILRAKCTSYTTETSCTTGDDGIPCVFDYPVGTTTGTKSCRQKECVDIQSKTNEECINQIANKNCVSDGTTCVKQDVCSKYTNKFSCKGGGSDGICAFTSVPTLTNLNAGTCQLFNSCQAANNDQEACQKKSQQCLWISTALGTTTTTSCKPMDCASAAKDSKCFPVPNFDNTSYTLCILTNGTCQVGDPTKLTSDLCYASSRYSYTWNSSANKCVSCKGQSSSNNSSNNGTQINNSNSNATDNGNILGITLLIVGFLAC